MTEIAPDPNDVTIGCLVWSLVIVLLVGFVLLVAIGTRVCLT